MVTNTSGYGKRPLWHWILLYVVIGGIIYGLIYYFVIAKKGGYNYSSGTPAAYPSQSQVMTQPTSGAGPSGPITPAGRTVIHTDSGFSPDTVTIKAGESITWTNNGGDLALDSNPHPIHTDYPALNIGAILPGESKSLAFPTAGTYRYHNHLNPGEGGTVIVQ